MTTASSRLVRAAVHQSPATTASGLLERAFSLWFSGFVYNQIWEDPRVDLLALRLTPSCRVLTIASGGCNVCHYLLAGAGEVSAVDLNRHHVHLTRLKLAAARHLPGHEAYFRFFGHGDEAQNVANYQAHVRARLEAGERAYWDERTLPFLRPRIDMFATGLYDHSRMGRFLLLTAAACRLCGKDPARILAAKTPAEREALFGSELDPFFKNALIRFLAGFSVGVFSLGIPPQQFRTLKSECPGGVIEEYRRRVKRLACDFQVADNYFAWQAFSRRYDRTGRRAAPDYLLAENFSALRAGAARATVEQTSLQDFLDRSGEASLDCYVLLDSQDWMTPEAVTRLWQGIRRTARPGARVIFRTAGTHSPLPGVVPDSLLCAFAYERERSRELAAMDRSAIYGGFHLYRLKD
jgi:S-adenosylmethionine-diacylglycerol 3-amino-3-carboxypropyl transferase